MKETVNTMTITLEEYNKLLNKVSSLEAKIASKDEVINGLNRETAILNDKLFSAEEKAEQNRTSIYVQNRDKYDGTYGIARYGITLQKDSPELLKIINEAINTNMEEIIKTQKRELSELRDELEQVRKVATDETDELREKHSAKVKSLNKELEELTKDYDDLKLDKAANLVEAERLEEVNKLKEQIAALEVSKEKDDIVWPRGLVTTLFRKQILEAAEQLYQQFLARKNAGRIDKTSAYGKAKDYLKTLNNKPDTMSGWLDYRYTATNASSW